MNYTIKKLTRAFTLVEVIVAIGVLGIGVLGIASFFAYSTKVARSSSNTSIASNLASGVIDEELSKPYDELNPGTGAKVKVTNDTASPLYNFSKEVTISLIDSDLANSVTDEGLKKIDVTISYQEGTSEKNVQMAEVKTQR